jgi:hypothetical protein
VNETKRPLRELSKKGKEQTVSLRFSGGHLFGSAQNKEGVQERVLRDGSGGVCSQQ